MRCQLLPIKTKILQALIILMSVFLNLGCFNNTIEGYISDSYCKSEMPYNINFVQKVDGFDAYVGNVDGTSNQAYLNAPRSMTKMGTKYYFTDQYSVKELDVSSEPTIRTIAGVSFISGAADGVGSAALFGILRGIANDGTYLYVTDSAQCAIRRIEPITGTVTNLMTAHTCMSMNPPQAS